jgi:hypothetical protein
MRALLAVITLSLAAWAFTPANTAEIRCDAGKFGHFVQPKDPALYGRLWPSGVRPTDATCASGLILGPIEQGDYEKVRLFYRQNHPFLHSFTLASPGGDVAEALKIGELFRKYLIIVFAPVRITSPDGREKFVLPDEPKCTAGKCLCASACALIWFGAVDHWGTVGLHRPHTDDPYFKNLDPTAAADFYRRVIDSIRQYLDEMEVPKSMIEAMVATGSADIKWVTVADDLSRPPSLAEWEDASCRTLSDDERNLLSRLNDKRAVLNQKLQKLRDKLQNKQAKRLNCRIELLASRRDKLPPP